MDEEELERIAKRRDRATAEVNRVRGDFLAAMIDLEAHIDRAIVFFFAPDEWHLFIEVFIEKMSLTLKVNTLRKMLRHQGLYEKHRELLKEFDTLKDERNKFAHQNFEFVGNSYMSEGGNYELYRKERLDPGPRVEDIIHLSDIKAMVRRAQAAERQALIVERELTRVHDPPGEYFERPGWDPRGLFGPATGVAEDESPAEPAED